MISRLLPALLAAAVLLAGCSAAVREAARFVPDSAQTARVKSSPWLEGPQTTGDVLLHSPQCQPGTGAWTDQSARTVFSCGLKDHGRVRLFWSAGDDKNPPVFESARLRVQLQQGLTALSVRGPIALRILGRMDSDEPLLTEEEARNFSSEVWTEGL